MESSLKQDILTLQANTNQRFEQVKTAFSKMDTKIDKVESSLKQNITEVESSLKKDITEVESSLKKDITKVDRKIDKVDQKIDIKIEKSQNTIIKWLIGLFIGQVSLIIALFKFL
ncbi:hypothetical protein GMMP15_90082 [Candidatus Magnetomoraceae bacterium gMMP-15]